MKKLIPSAIVAATALALSTTATAQSAQERLDERYNLALAAGYKALFMCGAIANAEANGTSRTPESVHEWELSGIQAPLDAIVRDLPYEIVRHFGDGEVFYTAVEWSDDASPRYAVFGRNEGCSIQPIGSEKPKQVRYQIDGGALWHLQQPARTRTEPLEIVIEKSDKAEPYKSGASPFSVLFEGALGTRYGEGRTTAVQVLEQDSPTSYSQWARYAEGFDEKTPQRTWSVAKSIAATVVGAVVYRGQADVQASAGLGEDVSDPRRKITIDHALRMASGRYSDTAGNRTDPLYRGGSTVNERAQNWPLVHTPGSVYRYANNDTLAAVVAVKDTFDVHPPAELLNNLGMGHTVAETDWRGNYVLSSQVWATTNDLAQLGLLYLNDGVLPDGTRILPEGWVDYVSDPSGPQPEGTQWGYGAGWWTFRRPEGNAFEGIPDDAFAARGNRGQYVVVVPSRDVVIVRRGEDMVGTRFDIAAFTRDVLAALED